MVNFQNGIKAEQPFQVLKMKWTEEEKKTLFEAQAYHKQYKRTGWGQLPCFSAPNLWLRNFREKVRDKKMYGWEIRIEDTTSKMELQAKFNVGPFDPKKE